jgi:hypothetical protein
MSCDWTFVVRRVLGTGQYLQIFWNTRESSPRLSFGEPMDREPFEAKLRSDGLTEAQVEHLLTNA